LKYTKPQNAMLSRRNTPSFHVSCRKDFAYSPAKLAY
jgi:hypothetical protein